jgi:hypothetical protein
MSTHLISIIITLSELILHNNEKGIKQCKFSKDDFCSHYTSDGVFKKREINKEYIPHGQQTAIEIYLITNSKYTYMYTYIINYTLFYVEFFYIIKRFST